MTCKRDSMCFVLALVRVDRFVVFSVHKRYRLIVKFYRYRNLQRYRAVLLAIARLSCFILCLVGCLGGRIGLVIERSLVRLPTAALSSSQLGQLSLPSLRGR